MSSGSSRKLGRIAGRSKGSADTAMISPREEGRAIETATDMPGSRSSAPNSFSSKLAGVNRSWISGEASPSRERV